MAAVNKNYSIAREDDGSIQITFVIPKEEISVNENKVLLDMSKDIEVSGFRKGNAPLDKVKESVSREKLIEKTLSKILPNMLSDALVTEKIKPAVYPKFELISASDNEDWQVRARLCEIIPFELGDYKTQIKSLISASKIWTPDKESGKENEKEISRNEKEQKIVEFLLKTIKPTIPKVLVEDEVNSRLSQLLERTEKLGLTLESYLSSIGKTPQTLREEYSHQSEDAIKLELILEKISSNENLSVSEADIDQAIKASSSDPAILDKTNSPEQRSYIKTILSRRKALDFLISII